MNRTITSSRPVAQYTDTENDMDGSMAEAELRRLQRQFRMLECERKAYAEESRTVIIRQTNSIKSLRKENNYLIDELRLLKNQLQDDKKSGAGSKKAVGMREQADLYRSRIKEISQEVQNLDRKLAGVNRAIARQRSCLSGGLSTAEKQVAAQKQVTALENRLDKSLVRFNKALESNGHLREQVDILRRERSVFDNSYRKFERELAERKKQMADIIEASTSAYEAREEAQTRMIALKERAEKEYQSYQQEVKELGRQLEQDRKLKEFMTIKSSERSESYNQLRKHANAQSTTKGSQEILAESMDNYEKAFTKIKEVTNCHNINELVKRFMQMEDQNFSLFNFVNEINNQIGSVAEEIASTERQIEQWNKQNAHLEVDSKAILQELEQKLKFTLESTEFFEKQYASMGGLLEDVGKGVERILGLLHKRVEGENAAATSTAAAVYASTGEHPLTAQLGHIEDVTNQLLMKNLLLSLPKKFTSAAAPLSVNSDKKDDGAGDKATQPLLETSKDPATLAAMLQSIMKEDGAPTFALESLLGQGPAAPITHVAIHAPSTGDDLDSDEAGSDEDERPLTRDELKQKTLKSIARRERKISAVEQGEMGVNSVQASSAQKSANSKQRRRRSKHQAAS